YFSEDGVHWGGPLATSGPSGDRNTVFYNPFRKVWVWSVRTNDAKMGRTRGYVENADVLAGARWKKVDDPLPWVGADKDDPRRDGFAAMGAGDTEGTLVTRPVTFRGKHLFVNVTAGRGELRATVLDRDGRAIPGLTRDNCVPVRTDSTRAAVTWKGADLEKL